MHGTIPTRSISCAPVSAPASPTGTPIGEIEGAGSDPLGDAMSTLGTTRIKVAGSIAEVDFRLLVSLRAEAVRSARLLQTAARKGGLFPAEYRAGAADALRAARALGRANVEYVKFVNLSGGPYGIGWPQLERRIVALLQRAKVDLNRAYEKAYTGTHY